MSEGDDIMTKNTVIKLLTNFLLIIIILVLTNYNVYAIDPDETDPTQNPNYYNPGTYTVSPDEKDVAEKVGKILGIINIVGVVVSVITLMIIGIKYMLGSIEEKAEYKKTVMYYLIGAALIFSGTTIPNILYKIGTSINTL